MTIKVHILVKRHGQRRIQHNRSTSTQLPALLRRRILALIPFNSLSSLKQHARFKNCVLAKVPLAFPRLTATKLRSRYKKLTAAKPCILLLRVMYIRLLVPANKLARARMILYSALQPKAFRGQHAHPHCNLASAATELWAYLIPFLPMH